MANWNSASAYIFICFPSLSFNSQIQHDTPSEADMCGIEIESFNTICSSLFKKKCSLKKLVGNWGR
jgi:hypothetical protein